MDKIQLIQFFKCMLIINILIFLIMSILLMLFKNLVKKLHAKLFGIQPQNIMVVVYSFLGLYKLMIIVFNLVPYFTLLLIR